MEYDRLIAITDRELYSLLMSVKESIIELKANIDKKPNYPNPNTARNYPCVSIAIEVIEKFRSELINDLIQNAKI